jgi:outer membrane protein TolC
MRSLVVLLSAVHAAAFGAQPAPGAPMPPAIASSAAAPAAAPRLADLVRLAWDRAALDRVELARVAEIDARERALRAPFAGPPSVGLDLRQGLPRGLAPAGTGAASIAGLAELAPGVSVPLWLPGQRDALRRLLDDERSRRAAALRAARLQLAGEVREAAWAQATAAAETAVQRERDAAAAALEADVVRRVDAGDLAPVDRLAARAERLAASAGLREAEARERAAAARLAALTGALAAGGLEEAEQGVGSADAVETHPAVLAAQGAVEAARSRLDAARTVRRDAPTLSAVARFERDAALGDARNSVRFGIAVPLDTEARNAPRLAAAGAELAEAEVALERERRERAAALERARIDLDASAALLGTADERAEVAGAAQRAIELAFAAGERSLPDVLRARQSALEARLAAATARMRRGLAIARMNQTLGIEP